MSVSSESENITFKNNDFGYDPTFDAKFVNHIYQLILTRNTKEVKKIITEILCDLEKHEDVQHTITMADEFSDNDDYEPSDEDGTDGDVNKLENIILPNGYKPLILAAQVALPVLVEYFISLGYDVNCKDSRSGMTPFLAACCSQRRVAAAGKHDADVRQCLRLLVEAGASIDSSLLQNNEHSLHLLAANNYVEPIKYLLPLAENVDCRNDRRSTPLMLAASKGYDEMVTLLLTAGADKSLRNINGHSPVELAMVNNHEDTVQLLISGSDNLEFYRAWSIANSELILEDSTRNIKESFLKNFNSKYQEDPLGYMCTNLSLTHLQPVLDRNGITFPQLRCMSDSELKTIGVTRFADRKRLLNTLQEVHKFPWNHECSIYSPDYQKTVKPNELVDVIESVSDNLEFMTSTVKYLCHHLTANSSYYSSELRIKSFLDKISNHCQVDSFEANNVHKTILKMDSFFTKMYKHALEEDLSSQLSDERERIKLQKSVGKYSNVVKSAVVISGLSVALAAVWRSKILSVWW